MKVIRAYDIMTALKIDKGFMTGEGVIMPSGKVVIEWQGDISSIVIYDSIDDVEKLHGNITYKTLISQAMSNETNADNTSK